MYDLNFVKHYRLNVVFEMIMNLYHDRKKDKGNHGKESGLTRIPQWYLLSPNPVTTIFKSIKFQLD